MSPINWPTPFYYEFAEGMGASGKEPCLVVFSNGQKLQGELTIFSPKDGIVEILSVKGGVYKPKLQFVNYLQLFNPMRFRKNESLTNVHMAMVADAPEKQKFAVYFNNGDTLDGVTAGFVIEKSGLYIYLAGDNEGVYCHFIPATSIKTYNVGDSIGQMLTKERLVTAQELKSGLDEQEQLRNKRIGEYLVDGKIVSPEQLMSAIGQQTKTNYKLGDVLVNEKLITQDQLEAALIKQKQDKKKALGEIIVGMGLVDEETIKRMLVKKLGIPFVDIKNYSIDISAVMLVPSSFIYKHTIMPLLRRNKTLVVAMENPMIWEPLNELRFLTNMNVIPVMASKDDILDAIKLCKSLEGSQNIDEIATDLVCVEGSEESGEENIAESDNTLVMLVNKVIIDAYYQGASDIHVETYSGKHNTKIRFRIDGVLNKYFEFPPNFRNALISRIKIMAKLDISEKRRPQDGKIVFNLRKNEKIELRVATVPTMNGLEDIVMRVFSEVKPIPLEDIGLSAEVLDRVKKMAAKPYGLFLICGPTGSGKTTTLHSMLSFLNTPGIKIWTAEDPIEITQDGLRQIQVNSRIGWTFATVMRSLLRADPDVIMIGEMRDIETAKIAIEASLTGHMIFSTLHTNSAAESMVRLLDLGMDAFNFSDALVGIMAQRLIKQFCKNCKKSNIASVDNIAELAREYCQNTTLNPDDVYKQWQKTYANENGEFLLYSAKGCSECGGTGYKGRIGLFEFLEATLPIKKLIQKHASAEELLSAALNQGMHTLKQNGIEKILQGFTDIHQIMDACIVSDVDIQGEPLLGHLTD